MLIEIPQDILKRDSKILGNFTARQIVSIAIGGGLGAAIGFGLLQSQSLQVRGMVAFIIALPFILIGFVRIYDQPLEKILPVIIHDNFGLPLVRPYKSELIVDEEEVQLLHMSQQSKKEKKQKMAYASRKVTAIR